MPNHYYIDRNSDGTLKGFFFKDHSKVMDERLQQAMSCLGIPAGFFKYLRFYMQNHAHYWKRYGASKVCPMLYEDVMEHYYQKNKVRFMLPREHYGAFEACYQVFRGMERGRNASGEFHCFKRDPTEKELARNPGLREVTEIIDLPMPQVYYTPLPNPDACWADM